MKDLSFQAAGPFPSPLPELGLGMLLPSLPCSKRGGADSGTCSELSTAAGDVAGDSMAGDSVLAVAWLRGQKDGSW